MKGIILALLILVLFPAMAHAQVVVQQINPFPVDNIESITLKNQSSEPVLLSGWKLYTQASPSTQGVSLADKVIESNALLEIEWADNKLNNDGDTVRLINPNQSEEKHTFGTASLGQIFWCIPTEERCQLESIPTVPQELPTDPPPTTTPTPIPTAVASMNLQLSEIYPCPPTGQSEWVEIYNAGDTTPELSGWHLSDASGQKRYLNMVFNTGEYKAITFDSGWLNNGGDTLRLMNDREEEVDRFTYSDCSSDWSHAKLSGGWQKTKSLTKGAANVLTPLVSPTTRSPDPSDTPKPNSTVTTNVVVPPTPTPISKLQPTTATASVAGIMDLGGEATLSAGEAATAAGTATSGAVAMVKNGLGIPLLIGGGFLLALAGLSPLLLKHLPMLQWVSEKFRH